MNENPNFEIKNGILKKYRGNAKEISLPEGITTIGAWAFSGCKSVSHITVPDGVEEICEGAFWSCSSLTEIRLPASLKKIGKAAFGRCENLKDENGFIILRGILFDVCEMKICAEIPEGVKEIAQSAFAAQTSLETIIFPKSLEKIRDHAFFACVNLNKLIFPEGLKNIGEGAFEGCRNVHEIQIPESMTEIGARCFYGCEKLSEISIPSGLQTLGDEAFAGCTGLKNADGFAVVKGILFDYFGSEENVNIPEGITEIGANALSEHKFPHVSWSV